MLSPPFIHPPFVIGIRNALSFGGDFVFLYSVYVSCVTLLINDTMKFEAILRIEYFV